MVVVVQLDLRILPGNVRELMNVIERAMILEDSDLITAAGCRVGWLVMNVRTSAYWLFEHHCFPAKSPVS